MRKYGIKEIFATLQGEGAQAGRPAVFLRFAGCNLGYQVCPWCDTDWEKAEFSVCSDELVSRLIETAVEGFGQHRRGQLLVATGGEPSLQLDTGLSSKLREAGFRIAMESNGSRVIDRSLVDWLTISPKQPHFPQKNGDELKVVFTGTAAPGITPTIEAVQQLAKGTEFDHYFLQPVDVPARGGPNFDETTLAVMKLGDPWRLSVQTHKVAGLR